MSKIDDLFRDLRKRGRPALMPFITAGDPDVKTTSRILSQVKAAGADLCEVGVPYSDPIADGPVIQASYQRALDGGFQLSSLFDLVGHVDETARVPMLTMASYSIIYRMGLQEYVDSAVSAGYAGAIVPDLLVEEAAPLAKICGQADFSLVQLVTPTTSRDRQLRIADSSTGFLYYVSVTGITGERKALPENLVENVSWLREQTALPICIGFGISGTESAKKLAPVADGLIVGSAIVRRIAEASSPQRACDDVVAFVRELRASIDAAVESKL